MSAAKVLDSLETVTGIDTETISPEEKLRRLEASNPGFKVYRMYDEGRLITNPKTLRAIAEAQEIAENWLKEKELEYIKRGHVIINR